MPAVKPKYATYDIINPVVRTGRPVKCYSESDSLDWREIFGIIGGSLTTIALIPQVWRLFKIKSAREISLPFTLMYLIGGIFWLTYGSVLGKPSIIGANAVALVLTSLMLYAKIKYGKY